MIIREQLIIRSGHQKDFTDYRMKVPVRYLAVLSVRLSVIAAAHPCNKRPATKITIRRLIVSYWPP